MNKITEKHEADLLEKKQITKFVSQSISSKGEEVKSLKKRKVSLLFPSTSGSKRTSSPFHENSLLIRKRNRYQVKTEASFESPSLEEEKSQTVLRKKTQLLNKLSPIAQQKKERIADPFQNTSIQNLVNNPYLNGKIQKQREIVMKKTIKFPKLYKFLSKVQQQESKFLQKCSKKMYLHGSEIILILINYAIDLKLSQSFCHGIKILAQFHMSTLSLVEAIFYFKQAWYCALCVRDISILIDSSIKMARIACSVEMHQAAAKILKKALEYAWFYNCEKEQYKIYDELGIVYYFMGDIKRSKSMHQRFLYSIGEKSNSPIRLLSKQALFLQIQKSPKVDQISRLFLLGMNIPIKSIQELPLLQNIVEESPREKYNRDMKYFYIFKPLRQSIESIIKSQWFSEEIGELSEVEGDWTKMIRKNKFLSFDIQRNKHLQSIGINFLKHLPHDAPQKPQNRFLKPVRKEKSLNLEVWYSEVIDQAKRDNMNKNMQLKNKVQIRGKALKKNLDLGNIRQNYQGFFSLIRLQQ